MIRKTFSINPLSIAYLATVALILAVFLLPAPAWAANEDPTQPVETPNIQASTCQGAELKFPKEPLTGQECSFTGAEPEDRLNELVASIVNLFSAVVGVVAVLMIIVGGFRYITSGGDSGNVSNAKNTILYAIVGLVIVALAQFIVKFVLAKATGVGG